MAMAAVLVAPEPNVDLDGIEPVGFESASDDRPDLFIELVDSALPPRRLSYVIQTLLLIIGDSVL